MKTRAAKVPEAPQSSTDTEPEACSSKIPTKPGDDLPPDSDDDPLPSNQLNNKAISNPSALSERHLNIVSKLNPPKPDDKEKQAVSNVTDLTISNKGFTCCIKQYGIKVPEESAVRANAGPGLRWKRMFGMFGTKIM
jgi:hypothetical protein